MSDPISLTGTAVGVISVGIQACQVIVSYCQAWRGYDEDIQSIARKADGLRTPLRVLRKMIEDTEKVNPEIASDLKEKTMSIQRAVTRLKTTTDRYGPTLSPEASRLRSQFKKAAYPFRKQTLHDMANDLDSIRTVLHTTLQV